MKKGLYVFERAVSYFSVKTNPWAILHFFIFLFLFVSILFFEDIRTATVLSILWGGVTMSALSLTLVFYGISGVALGFLSIRGRFGESELKFEEIDEQIQFNDSEFSVTELEK